MLITGPWDMWKFRAAHLRCKSTIEIDANGQGEERHDDDEQDVGSTIASCLPFSLGFGEHAQDQEDQSKDDDEFEEDAHWECVAENELDVSCPIHDLTLTHHYVWFIYNSQCNLFTTQGMVGVTKIKLFLFTGLLLLIPATAWATEFKVLAGPLPPFSVNKGMRTNGIGVDTFAVIAKMTGMPFDRTKVRFLDWSRAYAETMAFPNRVLLNVPRTPAVEDKFKWVGPIDFIQYVLVSKDKKDIQATSLSDFAEYKVGVVRGSGPCAILQKENFASTSLMQSSSYIQPLMQLRGNQVDLIAVSDMGVTWNMRKMRIDQEDYKVVHAFKRIPLYFAFNKKTDDATIQLLNNALESYKRPNPAGISAYEKRVVRYLPYGVVD